MREGLKPAPTLETLERRTRRASCAGGSQGPPLPLLFSRGGHGTAFTTERTLASRRV